jgi:small Trp-rich protein
VHYGGGGEQEQGGAHGWIGYSDRHYVIARARPPSRAARRPTEVVRMAFLIIGVLLLALKLAEFGPVADWGWTWVLLPFGLAVVWWAIADKTGLTRRRAMRKMDERKAERRQRSLEQLGLGTRVAPPRGSKPAPPPAGRKDPRA